MGVSRNAYYALADNGDLLEFTDELTTHLTPLMTDIATFAAGAEGVMAVDTGSILWWLPSRSRNRQRIATNVASAAVGDGANYYVTRSGALFVKGKAHRGQYGDGLLVETDQFIQTASQVTQVVAHTGHALLLSKNGDVAGTGGNIYGPVGRHGFGDKAIRWSTITSRVRAIATGASHSLAIRNDNILIAWGSQYGPEPMPIMEDVAAVAAGSATTVALKQDGMLWQWGIGEKPRQVRLEKE